MIADISYFGDLAWALSCFFFSLLVFAATAMVFGLIVVGCATAFKSWRLYSRNPIAKRIRRFLFVRREAARAAKAVQA